jgi:hypothetical protein
MKSKITFILAMAIISVFAFQLILSCGGGKETKPVENITAFFTEEVSGTRAEDVKIYEGQTLYEYIDGGAELYHEYGFVRVATATYKDMLHEIILDVYQFNSAENAYGLYTRVRPPEPNIINLGVEGFTREGTLDFVKGKYLVRLTAYDMSQETADLEAKIATGLDSIIPGTTARPQGFALFPDTNKIPYTEMFYAEAYYGHSFLTQVYTQNYDMGEDTVTLFYTSDPTGEKFLQWSQLVENDEEQSANLRKLPFDDSSALIVPDEYFGDLVAGLKAGRLAGMVNYKDKYSGFMSSWLNSLK